MVALCVVALAVAAPTADAGRRTALIAAGWPLTVVDERGDVRWQGPDGAFPAFSPGGDRVAFALTGSQGAAVADLRTGRVAAVEGYDGPARWPLWSPDGDRIAFLGLAGTTATGAGQWHLFTAPARGGCCARQVTSFPPESAGVGYARWSPSGDLVAAVFMAPDTATDDVDLFTIDPRSGSQSPLVDGLADGELAFFDVSPVDGSIIVWARSGDAAGLWRLDTGGGPPALLAAAGLTAPAWSPDGRWVAWLDEGLHVVRADGRGRRVVTDVPEAFDAYSGPAWFPDGRRLAYVADARRDDPADLASSVVVTVGVDGGEVRVVGRAGSWFGGPAVAPVFVPAR